MTLDELLDAIRGADADAIGDFPGYADEIARIVGDGRAGADAALAEANEALAAKDAEIQRLQAENYKLMVAAGDGASDSAPEPVEDPEPEDINPEDYISEED